MSEMLERILSDENIMLAKRRVYANKGASGVDGVTVQELDEYMFKNWENIREQIRERKYKPQPVLRVEIPKENGGVRKLGIPTVIDRTIEQAIAQVISPMFEVDFHDNSYGFRPGRSCEQAIENALAVLNMGYEWIVDIDLTTRIKMLNAVIRGWINYFALGDMKGAMEEIDSHLRTMLRIIIWKQWKTPAKRQWGLMKLGFCKDIARCTAYCGNRYYWIVTKTCVVRAISKEKLTKRGLVSPLDYYLHRHSLKLR